MAKLDYANEQGFDFFRTYAGCALRAHRDGLFSDSEGESLVRVFLSVEADLCDINFQPSVKGRAMRTARWKDFLADIRRACDALGVQIDD